MLFWPILGNLCSNLSNYEKIQEIKNEKNQRNCSKKTKKIIFLKSNLKSKKYHKLSENQKSRIYIFF